MAKKKKKIVEITDHPSAVKVMSRVYKVDRNKRTLGTKKLTLKKNEVWLTPEEGNYFRSVWPISVFGPHAYIECNAVRKLTKITNFKVSQCRVAMKWKNTPALDVIEDRIAEWNKSPSNFIFSNSTKEEDKRTFKIIASLFREFL